LIAAAGLPDRVAAGPTKKCPACAEQIRIEALRCPHCALPFDKDEVTKVLVRIAEAEEGTPNGDSASQLLTVLKPASQQPPGEEKKTRKEA
jgi:predicted amidophosphoribosyltransferase